MFSFRFRSHSAVNPSSEPYEREEPRLVDTQSVDPALLRDEEDWCAPCPAQRAVRWGLAAGLVAAAAVFLVAQAMGVNFRERFLPPVCTAPAAVSPGHPVETALCALVSPNK